MTTYDPPLSFDARPSRRRRRGRRILPLVVALGLSGALLPVSAPLLEEAAGDEPAAAAMSGTPGVGSHGPIGIRPIAESGAAPSASVALLHDELLGVLGTGAGRTGEWGVLAVSAVDGDVLFARNAEAALAPASNQKLFTSAAALHELGPEFRFPTYLLARGRVDAGVLQGDLILYGTGDPSMASRLLDSAEAPFREFARALREQGVHTITGDVVGDGSFFSGPTRHPSWNAHSLNEWYAAPISGLSWNENVVTLQIRAAGPGARPEVRTHPSGAVLPLDNQGLTVSGAARRPLLIVRDDPDEPIGIQGEIRPGQGDVWRRLTVSDPPTFAASVLLRVLQEEGITVRGRPVGVSDPTRSALSQASVLAPALRDQPLWTVAVHQSPALPDLLAVVNQRSHNLYADALLFTLGRVTRGTASFEAGAGALTDYLTEVVGMDADGLNIEDGSGLSRFNRARPLGFVQVLAHMDADSHGAIFWGSLPEAGDRQGLRRMYRSEAAGNLRAKTGTINRVSALSGRVTSRAGEPVYFSIMANNVPSTGAAKRVEDRIGIQLASFSRPLGPGSLPGATTPGAHGSTTPGAPTVHADGSDQDRP
ncbi:MAG: D-alanyl-D-alanine carboxypeptidase/D-alanyl-D-alanine-endopeptidase [Gemmatimonadales bacterium]|nr:MAG: D-alanyl-D-alanine carboxypeptidase/D-alanyl-D-alanine-endopeptidase [Gemmatimonadales bacterium]